MKINFRKIASALASTAMISSTVALAAAASFPAPFVDNGVADVAIVYGSNLDMSAVTDISTSLSGAVSGSSGGVVLGGDFVQLDKSSNRLNLGDAMNGPFGSTVDDGDLPVLLADGIYTADDSDTFDYEQKITLGATTLTHFRDSEYEQQQGLTTDTPTVGFKLSSNNLVLNYTLDFLDQPESAVVSSDLDDFEGSDLPLFGGSYYVSNWDNSTTANKTLGALTLLDSASQTLLSEGATTTMEVGGNSYTVGVEIFSSTQTVFTVNGETTNTLQNGETYQLPGGDYIGVREILYVSKDSGTSSVDFSIGSGKIELTHGSAIKINDDSVNEVKAYLKAGTPSSGIEKIDSIVLEWITDDDEFITPDSTLAMPGFETVAFSMNDLVRNDDDVITVRNDGDTSMELSLPITDGDASINILFSNSSGDFIGIGKDSDERLATSANTTLYFAQKYAGSNYHEGFVVTYNDSDSAESYYLDLDITEDSGDGRNETSIRNIVTGLTETNERTAGNQIDIGDVSFTVKEVHKNNTDEWAILEAGSNVNFNTIYSTGGMRVYLPFTVANNQTNSALYPDTNYNFATGAETVIGAINMSGVTTNPAKTSSTTAGHSFASYYLSMIGEDKDDNLGSGTGLALTFNENTDNELQVSQVNTTGTNGVGSGTGGLAGLEQDDSNIYEAYVIGDVGTMLTHKTEGDQDSVQVFYSSGESEFYAELLLSDVSGTPGVSVLGNVNVLDTELESSGMSTNNLIVVGGSCVNTAAATLLNGAGCGSSWTAATGLGSDNWVIETFANPWASSKVATLVAGWEQGDTANAATHLTTQTVSTDVGEKVTDSTVAVITP